MQIFKAVFFSKKDPKKTRWPFFQKKTPKKLDAASNTKSIEFL